MLPLGDPLRSALLALGVVLLGGCAPPWAGDTLVERCVEVIQYRQPDLREIDVVGVERAPGSSALTLEFEAVSDPSGPRVESRIDCGFDSAGRWTLERVAIGGRALTEAEIALVNSELLLRDLSRNPERLRSAPARSSS
jgi:hypothetical protein